VNTSPFAILRGLLFNNIGLKLVSLIAAIALFSVVHGAEDAQKTVYVDVISTLPAASSGQMLISEIPVRVRVALVGSPSQLNGIRPGDIPPIELDLRDIHRTSYEIETSDVDVPAGVTVTAIEPSSIPLDWVVRRERRVRVRPALVGSPRSGRMLVDPVRVEPESVTVIGPKNEIEGLVYVETAEIELSGLGDGRSERRVRLMHLPEHVIIEGDATVAVTLEIMPERSERTISHVPVAAIGVTTRSMRPTHVNVTILGPPAVVQNITSEQILPFVDGTALRTNRTPQLLRVQVGGLPEGVELRRANPPEVLVTPN
jgi:YbbR domain-containing protein